MIPAHGKQTIKQVEHKPDDDLNLASNANSEMPQDTPHTST